MAQQNGGGGGEGTYQEDPPSPAGAPPPSEGISDTFATTRTGIPYYLKSFGGNLDKGTISISWSTKNYDNTVEIEPYVAAVTAREAAGGGGFGPILARVFTVNISTGLSDELSTATWLYGLVAASSTSTSFLEIPTRPFGISINNIPAEEKRLNGTLEEDSTYYLPVELEYLYETLGYDDIGINVDAIFISTKLDNLLAKVGTSDIANQILNNVVDYGKIRASQVTTISQQEASQTISIGKGDTSAY